MIHKTKVEGEEEFYLHFKFNVSLYIVFGDVVDHYDLIYLVFIYICLAIYVCMYLFIHVFVNMEYLYLSIYFM